MGRVGIGWVALPGSSCHIVIVGESSTRELVSLRIMNDHDFSCYGSGMSNQAKLAAAAAAVGLWLIFSDGGAIDIPTPTVTPPGQTISNGGDSFDNNGDTRAFGPGPGSNS